MNLKKKLMKSKVEKILRLKKKINQKHQHKAKKNPTILQSIY